MKMNAAFSAAISLDHSVRKLFFNRRTCLIGRMTRGANPKRYYPLSPVCT
jgi:hypothetical protein